MGTPTGLAAFVLLLAGATGGGVLLWGAAIRRRTARHTLETATSDAERIIKQAERDA